MKTFNAVDRELDDQYRSLLAGGFDVQLYVSSYPDVLVSGMSPVEHFLKIGRDLGRVGTQVETSVPRSSCLTVSDTPKVSVICITFDHEKFIEETLEGFINQKVDFPVEFIVADDCSRDSTQSIIRRYAAQDSRIIPLLREKNIGVAANFADAASRVRAPYVAMCEGDDYWTDPYKLFRQVQILDQSSDVSLVFHPVEVLDDESKEILFNFPEACDMKPSLQKLVRGNFIQTNSVMYRWCFQSGLPSWIIHDVKPLDWLLHLAHARLGRMHYIDRLMAVYRKHGGGMWANAGNIKVHRRVHGIGELSFFNVCNELLGPVIGKEMKLHQESLAVDMIEDAVLTENYRRVDEILTIQTSLKNFDTLKNFEQTGPNNKISVVVLTYNHAGFIRQCLDSILMQKGPLKLEVIIGDDCSTDGTDLIAEEYQVRFPEIIRNLRSTSNVGMLRNMQIAISECTGDFIAFCEGDDYWLSDKKLTKQMLFLMKRPNFAMCFNWVLLDDGDSGSLMPHPHQAKIKGEEVSVPELAYSPLTANFSCCFYRASTLRNMPSEYYETANAADWLFNIYVGQMGRIGFLRETLSSYRIHLGGQWSGLSTHVQAKRFANARDVCASRFGPGRGFDDLSVRVAIVPQMTAEFHEHISAHLDAPSIGAGNFIEFDGILFHGWAISKMRQHLRIKVTDEQQQSIVGLTRNRIDVANAEENNNDFLCNADCGFEFEVKFFGKSKVIHLEIDVNGTSYPWMTLVLNLVKALDKEAREPMLLVV